ncbi:hypothetical protein ACFL5Z_06450 [Planctomycetota bacterium]
MAGYESQGPASLRGIPNFYRTMFFLSLILFVLLPMGILSSDIGLELRENQFQIIANALEAELESLSQQIAADSKEIDALDVEVSQIARSEQVFTESSEQHSLWRPDARWSEMGKVRVQEIWLQRGILGNELTQSRDLVRQKRSDLIRTDGRREQIINLRKLIKEHIFMFYGVLLFGVFTTVLFALLWSVLQGRVNMILRRWAK